MITRLLSAALLLTPDETVDLASIGKAAERAALLIHRLR